MPSPRAPAVGAEQAAAWRWQLAVAERERQLHMQLEAQKNAGLALADEFAERSDRLHQERMALDARCTSLARDLHAAQEELERMRAVRLEEQRQLARCIDERDAAQVEARQQGDVSWKAVSILEQRVANLTAQAEAERSDNAERMKLAMEAQRESLMRCDRYRQTIAHLYKQASSAILNADESLQSAVGFNHAIDAEQTERALDEVGRALQIATRVVRTLKGLSSGLLDTVHRQFAEPNGTRDGASRPSRPASLSHPPPSRPASHPSSLRAEHGREMQHV